MKDLLSIIGMGVLWGLGAPLPFVSSGGGLLRAVVVAVPLAIVLTFLFKRSLHRALTRAGTSDSQANHQSLHVLAPSWVAGLAPIAMMISAPGLALCVLFLAASLVVYRFVVLFAVSLCPSGRHPVQIVFWVCFMAGVVALFRANIVHDAFQYYGYLVSLAFDRDLNLYDQIYIQNTYRFYNPFPIHSARYAGTWLLESPFFLVGHLLARVLNHAGGVYVENGYSLPYLFCISLASGLFGLAGLMLSYRLARQMFSRTASMLAVIAVGMASPLPFFMYCWNGWAHPFAMFFVAAFLLVWYRTRGCRMPLQWTTMGVLGGWLCLTLPAGGLILICPAMEVAQELRAGKGRWTLTARGCIGVALFVLGAVVAFSPQGSLWKAISGSWLADPYSEVGDVYNWLHPDFLGFLFATAQHGLLAWSPVIIPATLGVVLLWGRDRVLGAALTLVVALTAYLYASWSIWWSGVGFSNRFVIHLSPILILGTACLVDRLERHVSRQTLVAVVAVLVFWNLSLMGAYLGFAIPMGIPDPYRVVDVPWTFSQLVHLQWQDAPKNLLSLLGGHWINENFFAGRIWSGIRFGNAGEVLGTALVLGAVGVLAWGVIRLACMPYRHALQVAVVAALLGVALLAHAVIGYAASRTRPLGRFHHIEHEINIQVRQPAEDTHIYCQYPLPVTTVDLLSCLAYGHDVLQGAPVATVTVVGANGEKVGYTLRGGVDTAETSYARPESRNAIRHSLGTVEAARSEPATLYSRSRYELLTFRTTIHLGAPMVVQRIDLRYVGDSGLLVVSDIFLRDL